MDNQPISIQAGSRIAEKSQQGNKNADHHYLIAGQRKKKTSKILLSLAFIIPLLSNSIIFEAWYTETEDTEGTYSEEEFKSKSYIIDHGDGTYDLYLDGQAFSIESPDRPEFEGIKIFKE